MIRCKVFGVIVITSLESVPFLISDLQNKSKFRKGVQ